MTWHIIEGEAGCAFARERGAVALVVDALRASATAAMLLHHGARELWVVREVEEAFAAREQWPDALLYGERGGLPPAGFDGGNSPAEAEAAAGRRVVFTTTTGAGRLVAAWGAPAAYLATTLNASAAAAAARSHGHDVVLIPAGLMDDTDFDAQEDRVAAVAIAMQAREVPRQGRDTYDIWRPRIEKEGLEALFQAAPHADKLRAIGKEADIALCARLDVTDMVCRAVEAKPPGVIVRAEPANRKIL